MVRPSHLFEHRGNVGEDELLSFLMKFPEGISIHGVSYWLKISEGKVRWILSDLVIEGRVNFSEVNPHKIGKGIRIYMVTPEEIQARKSRKK
jgi:predicted ArsR family transcriptional regulator